MQIEEFDAELEALSGVKQKKGAKPPARQQHLDDSILRHRQHITRLEQMLRLLDNDAITVGRGRKPRAGGCTAVWGATAGGEAGWGRR